MAKAKNWDGAIELAVTRGEMPRKLADQVLGVIWHLQGNEAKAIRAETKLRLLKQENEQLKREASLYRDMCQVAKEQVERIKELEGYKAALDWLEGEEVSIFRGKAGWWLIYHGDSIAPLSQTLLEAIEKARE